MLVEHGWIKHFVSSLGRVVEIRPVLIVYYADSFCKIIAVSHYR